MWNVAPPYFALCTSCLLHLPVVDAASPVLLSPADDWPWWPWWPWWLKTTRPASVALAARMSPPAEPWAAASLTCLTLCLYTVLYMWCSSRISAVWSDAQTNYDHTTYIIHIDTTYYYSGIRIFASDGYLHQNCWDQSDANIRIPQYYSGLEISSKSSVRISVSVNCVISPVFTFIVHIFCDIVNVNCKLSCMIFNPGTILLVYYVH